MKKLLIIVDVINGFISEGNLHDVNIGRIIPGCVDYLEEFLEANQEVIAFCDNHREDSREFTAYPTHCLHGSSESQLVDELKVYQDKIKIIPKNSTNGFMAPLFREYWERLNEYQEVLIIGCCSDICVLQLALSLKTYCNEHNYQTEIIVDSQVCDTFGSEIHDRDSYNEMAFKLMRNSGIKVLEDTENE